MAEEVMMVPTKDYANLVNYYKGQISESTLLNKAGRLAAERRMILSNPSIPDAMAVQMVQPKARESIDQSHPDGPRPFCALPDPQGRRGRGRGGRGGRVRRLDAERPVGKHVEENPETHQKNRRAQDTDHTLGPAQVDRL